MKTKMIMVVAVMAGTLVAQGPGGPGARRFGGPGGPGGGHMAQEMGGRGAGAGMGNAEALKAALGLNDTQVQQLRDLRKQQAEAARQTLEQIRTKRDALATAMKGSTPDSAEIGQLMVDIRKLSDTMKSARAEREVKALAILTPDQKTKLTALQDAQKLMPAVTQATAMGLLEPPAPSAAATVGAMGRRGMAGRGAPRQ